MSSNIREMRAEVRGLKRDLEDVDQQANKTKSTITRTLGLVRRSTGSESLAEGIRIMQAYIAVTQRAHATLTAFQIARMAAGDPLAWIGAGLAVAELGFSAVDAITIGDRTH